MNLAWKLVMFTFMLNISSGIMINILDIKTNVDYDAEQMANLDVYDVQDPETSVFDNPPAQTEANWADNLLGLLGLGFIIDILDFFTNYLYGITDIIMEILPREAKVSDLSSYINALITIMYSISLFALFTGKKFNEEG